MAEIFFFLWWKIFSPLPLFIFLSKYMWFTILYLLQIYNLVIQYFIYHTLFKIITKKSYISLCTYLSLLLIYIMHCSLCLLIPNPLPCHFLFHLLLLTTSLFSTSMSLLLFFPYNCLLYFLASTHKLKHGEFIFLWLTLQTVIPSMSIHIIASGKFHYNLSLSNVSIYFYLYLYKIYMYILHILYPLIYQWAFRFFLSYLGFCK